VTPERLRAYVVIFTADVAPCLMGMFITIYGFTTRTFESYLIPLVMGLFGIPFVRPRVRPPVVESDSEKG
jgi:hypothetical protein